MNRTTLVSPSILAADFANIETEVKMVNDSAADYIHIDIMDGHFVPNISFGFPVTKAIQKHSKKPLDFHLMISNPDNYLEACIDSGAAIITVHVEVCHDLWATINRIKKFGAKAGVAVNPGTDIESLKEIISDIDLVLLMSVNPGFGGQSFIDNTYNKVLEIKELSSFLNKNILIEIDGGVNASNAAKLISTGANMLVAGSYVFNAPNPIEVIQSLKML